MIENDEQLALAQTAVRNLQEFLQTARKTHESPNYRVLSTPILLEIQQREQEILDYLSRADAPAPTHSSAG